MKEIKCFSISPRSAEILNIIKEESGLIPSNVVDKLILDKAAMMVKSDVARKRIAEVLCKSPKDYKAKKK